MTTQNIDELIEKLRTYAGKLAVSEAALGKGLISSSRYIDETRQRATSCGDYSHALSMTRSFDQAQEIFSQYN